MTTDGTPPVSEKDVPLVAETDSVVVAEVDLPVPQEDTLVAGDGTPPVVGDNILLPAKDNTPKASVSQGSGFATWGKRLRMFVAYVLLLAVLGGAGICAFALVQGTWQVTPVLSGSMRPGLAVGGAVISQRVPGDSLHVRDVIIFNDPYSLPSRSCTASSASPRAVQDSSCSTPKVTRTTSATRGR